MSGSQREDYLLRQARAVAAMLARIAGLRTSGRTEEARAQLDEAYGLLVGSEAELLRRVDASTAALCLGSKERILAYSQLLREEAALEAGGSRRAALRACAEALETEAARLPGGP
ncbi:MAG TPA: hypothetical protein VMS93_03845 [Candidatus Saccharimonadales bacterium]|nr:hypothetical protein [Candidatus Saccharimonadales bacterium]